MTETPHYEFIYFNFRGKGEISRLLFAYAGVDYDDVRIPFSDWPAYKAETPYGQLPLLKVNKQTLAQSKAIARYLANEFGLAGKSRIDRAKADMIVEVVHNDIMAKAVELYYEKDEVRKETLRKEYAEYLEHMFTRFQDQLRENGGKFFVGNENMTETPHYEFIYFNFRGKGEISRLLFAYAGVDYDDVRIPFSDWPAYKAETPYGQLPLLKVNKQTLAQSKAIARYLANEFGLAGNSKMDRAKADMIVEVVHNDIMAKAVELYYEKDEVRKETLRKEYAEYLEHMFTRFQDQLRENGGKFFVGNELTWADLAVADCVDWPRDSGIDLDMEKYPLLRVHQEKVYAIPNIKEWLQKRPVTIA